MKKEDFKTFVQPTLDILKKHSAQYHFFYQTMDLKKDKKTLLFFV